MRLPRSLRHRSSGEWTARSLIAAVTAAAGYVAVTQAIAVASLDKAPDAALRLWPGNGRIANALSAKLSMPGAGREDLRHADQLARQALLADPVSPDALATLGTVAQAHGDSAAAKRYFEAATRLSRRETRSQAWAIQDAVVRQDVPAVVRHYDILLRTTPAAAPVLYPPLAAAVVDRRVSKALAAALAQRPPWGDGFIAFIAGNGPDPVATAHFFEDLARRGVTVSDASANTAVSALLADSNFDEAWSYYASLHKEATRSASRDPRFEASSDTPSPFDWVPINDGTISTAIQRGKNGGAFTFQAPPSIGGALLQQVELLAPGQYRLTGHSNGVEQPRETAPFWSLTCRGGAELGRIPLPNSSTARGMFTGTFTVPANCPVQVLAFNALPSSAIGGLSGELDRVSLEPVR